MSIKGGYKTITITQLGNLLHALRTGKITWLAARAWFAGLEMTAIREAATRCRRLQGAIRPKTVPPRYTKTELAALTGLNPRAIANALGQLRGYGLAEFTTNRILVPNVPLPEACDFIQVLSGGRSVNRPVPVPRSLLRFLASQQTAALGKVMLGYICRGLSIARSGGAISASGSVKASWLAETLRLSERSVRYAQLELRSLGWIGKDTGSKQWKLNRDGAWFCINLEWVPSAKNWGTTKPGNGDLHRTQIAPPPTESCVTVAPLNKDMKTPSESKNQRTASGVFKTEANFKSNQPKPERIPHPTLANIRIEDLRNNDRLRALLNQAVAKGWVKNCEADALNFFGAAIRARTATNGNPVRIFVSLVKRRLWNHITLAQETDARRMLTPTLRQNTDSTPSPCMPVRSVLNQLLTEIGIPSLNSSPSQTRGP